MTWSEDSLHRWFATWPRPRVVGGSTGHDAAVLRRLAGRAVVCVDQCVEGVHFTRGTAARLAGRKAANRALSDLAATAARPRALLLAVDAPRRTTERELRALIAAVRAAGRACGAELVGGDLCASRGPLRLAVTAIGEVPATGRSVGRDRARPGQRVVLTGPLGGSILGRHLRFRPRLEAGRLLARCGATALMDVSDGLALDLFRIARASGVALEIDGARIPVHADARKLARRTRRAPLDHALHDGEDHELIATLAARDFARAARAVPGLVEIGRVRAGTGLVLLDEARAARRWRRGRGGYEHGA